MWGRRKRRVHGDVAQPGLGGDGLDVGVCEEHKDMGRGFGSARVGVVEQAGQEQGREHLPDVAVLAVLVEAALEGLCLSA